MELHLSKSKYCRAWYCPKMLWLDQNRVDFVRPDLPMMIKYNAKYVGDVAKGLFGDYKEVTFVKENLKTMVEETRKFIDEGVKNIAEASFLYNGLFCSVDILRNLGDNEFELYEVKSSTKTKEEYYQDVAFQYYVLSKLGYNVTKCCLVVVNNNYYRHGEIEVNKLLSVNDVTERTKELYDDVESRLKMLEQYLDNGEEPPDCVGEQCLIDPEKQRYCEHFDYCTRHLGTPNIFNINGHSINFDNKIAHYKDGHGSYQELIKQKLPPLAKKQVEFEIYNKEPEIKKEKLRKFLDTLTYPIYFLDFETLAPAVPLYDGTKAYGSIPFQYSLHIVEKEGAEAVHKGFLGDPSINPVRELAERLCKDIPREACIVAFHKSAEETVIKNLAALPELEDLREHLSSLLRHFVNMEEPFSKRYYYCKELGGKSKIKIVLPALFPSDKNLNYSNLEGVHNGEEAPIAYMEMLTLPIDECEMVREQLERYCELDTYAMVLLWKKLKEFVE